MAYVINDDCISCGACAAGCPVEAISEGAAHYEINADVCVDCGACAGTCPVGAPNPQYLQKTPDQFNTDSGFYFFAYSITVLSLLKDLRILSVLAAMPS